ncbi:MAG TPA: pyridoxamine 5'-phosphate oxidase family protein [Vicinamibacteria bacterium]|nr:pyridoxamine 5'-phosphate oxidase family protein [Vicinamibacteria bacterium]
MAPTPRQLLRLPSAADSTPHRYGFVTAGRARHLKVVLGPFHDGEREMQARAGVRDEAEAVGRIIRNTIPPDAGRFLAQQRLAVATTLDPGGRVWSSLLTGEPGFIRAVDETLLRLDAQPVPGDPPADNLATQPWLGLLVLDPQTRGRMRFNRSGLLSADGLFLEADQVYGNCPKYIQLRRLGPDAEAAPAPAPSVSRRLDPAQQSWIASATPSSSAPSTRSAGPTRRIAGGSRDSSGWRRATRSASPTIQATPCSTHWGT